MNQGPPKILNHVSSTLKGHTTKEACSQTNNFGYGRSFKQTVTEAATTRSQRDLPNTHGGAKEGVQGLVSWKSSGNLFIINGCEILNFTQDSSQTRLAIYLLTIIHLKISGVESRRNGDHQRCNQRDDGGCQP